MIFKAKKKSGMIPTVTVVVFGAGGVGKTSLIRRYMYNSFEETYSPTIEDAFRKVVDYRGALADLTIIDMAGGYEFPAMRRHAIEHGHGFLIVYAVDDPLSVEEAKRLFHEIQEVKGDKRVPLLFVCNKIDKLADNNLFSVKAVQEELLGDKQELTGAAESSAKLNVNVGQIFSKILGLVAKESNERQSEASLKASVARRNSKSRSRALWKTVRKYLRIRSMAHVPH